MIITRSGFFKRGYNLAAAPSGGGGGFYPNRPSSGYANTTEINFSQSIPTDTGLDDPIIGSDEWVSIHLEGNWVKTTDATAPQSPSDIWRGSLAAGVYGDGHGIGNVFTNKVNGASKLYISLRHKWNFPNLNWHSVSNKFINMFANNSTILVQANESGNWRHCGELGKPGFGSIYVDDGVDDVGEDHISGRIDNRIIPTNQWVQIEVVIDLTGHIWKVWQDGVLTTDATPNFSSTNFEEFGVYCHRGGGGETLADNISFDYDHFFVAYE